MKIHKEGYGIIAIAFILLSGLCFAFWSLIGLPWINYILTAAAVVFFFLIVQFFRSPKRNIQRNDNHIICPADGKAVVIEEVEETEYFKEKRLQISIFMSPLNVHVNRFPVGGKVKYVKYHPGKYLVAWHPKSSTENERTTIVVDNNNREVLFRQIAGAVARRIRYYCKENCDAVQGEEFGFIKFGSRVDVFLPLDVKVNVKLGEKVKGGETILASFE